ncbi:ferredoxin (plasmid) [Rhodococcus sp. USK10]|uniref:ferredoxin n=1 Tax=Rhodococcus sp. USK10 TaxID=2789739 RepID=UPI001C5CE97D|nr:ferredoxin [Rhodococcus sp. USK10]QYB00106.1 ferredoxin [Rhodococcus sp. USK10]
MTQIHADRARCEGYGNCVMAAPELVDLDDDGVVILIRDRVDEAEVSKAESAVRACPVNALRVDK